MITAEQVVSAHLLHADEMFARHANVCPICGAPTSSRLCPKGMVLMERFQEALNQQERTA